MDLKPGFRLGRYILEEPVGKGAQGMVFFARQVNAVDGTPCVVKLAKKAALDDVERERFLAEARRGKDLGDHPNIAHVVDVAVHEGVPFFVMSYGDGADLEDLLAFHRKRGEALMWDAIYTILTHMSDALHWAHFGRTIKGRPIGLIHRDIKPANTWVTFLGYTKLLDFGISVFRDDEQTGMHLRGTPRYMSPEHVYSEPCPEMDIYSLGVVAWEMVEGRIFREGLSPDMVARANCHQPPPPITNPEAPKELVELIMTCLNEDRTERPTAEEFSRWLMKCPGYQLSTGSVKALVTRVLGREARSRETLWSLRVPDALGEPQMSAAGSEGDEDGETVAWVRGAFDNPTEPRNVESDAPRRLRRRPKSPETVVVVPRVSPTVVIRRNWAVKEPELAETVALPLPSERAPTVQMEGRSVPEEGRRTVVDGSPVYPQPSGERGEERGRRRTRVLLFFVGVLVSSGLAGLVAMHLLGAW